MTAPTPRTALTAGDNPPGDVKANHPAGTPRRGTAGAPPAYSPPGSAGEAAPSSSPGDGAAGVKKRNKPKAIGTATETAAVRALWRLGFPGAERRALRGRSDAGDILVCPGIIAEVKGGERARNATDLQIASWLDETEKERLNAGAAYGLLIVQRRGIGAANADRWWVVVWVATLLELHRQDWMPELAPWHDAPVRMRLDHLCRLLVNAGYGTPPPHGEAS